MLLTEWDNTVGTRFGAARKQLGRRGRAHHRRADAAARRDAGGQRQGRLRAGGGLRDPSRAACASARTTSIRTCACASSAAATSRRPTMSRCRRRARAADPRDGRAGCPHSTRWCCRPRRSSRRRSPRCRTPSTFNTKNMLLLRNTTTWNFFDMCAISIPIPGSRLAGRADAGRAQRPRPPAVRDRGRNRASFRRVSRGSPGARYVIGHNNTCPARPKASTFAQTFQGGIHEHASHPPHACWPAPPPRCARRARHRPRARRRAESRRAAAALRRAGRHRPGLLPRRRARRSDPEGSRPARSADHERRHRDQRRSGALPRREADRGRRAASGRRLRLRPEHRDRAGRRAEGHSRTSSTSRPRRRSPSRATSSCSATSRPRR